jgi:hypothetical protein
MTPELLNQVRTIGIALILAAALVLLLVNAVLLRLMPRVVLPTMVFVWLAGAVGFIMVLLTDHSPLNVLLAVLFLLSIGYHGSRIVARARRIASPEPEDHDAEEP